MPSEKTRLLKSSSTSPPLVVRSTCTSTLFFTWLTPLLALGSQKTLGFDDLYPLSVVHQATHVSEQFHATWHTFKTSSVAPAKPSLTLALFQTFGWRFAVAGLLRGIRATLLFTAPLVLKAMIGFLNDSSAPISDGYVLVAIIFVSGMVQSLCIRQYTYLASEVGMCFRTAIQSALYHKLLVIAPSSTRSSGQVTNLMSVDATRVQKLTMDLHSIWVVPYLILMSCVLLWREIGVSFVAGLVVIVLYIPLTLYMAKHMKAIQRQVMQFKDSRTKLCNEVWGGIKVVKCQAWEDNFVDIIQAKRVVELAQLSSFLRTRSLSSALSNGLPALVAIASFATYIFLGNNLDVGTALTTLALFNILRLPLLKMPDMVNAIVEAQLSLDRLRDFLLDDELSVVGSGPLTSAGIRLTNVTLQYPHTSATVLKDVTLAASDGALVALVGATGCGKSSLLRGVLGEAHAVDGSIYKYGTIAYVAQQPFILNATVRDNILFGLPFDHARYTEAIDVCCLESDLATLGAGDATEIGEKGITLSGGQRTRVALARAVYQNADVYLLDDVLAAVDNDVGRRLFTQCIQGVLNRKVVVLATNSPAVLHGCDQVVVLGDNRVVASGSLLDVQDVPYMVAMLQHHGASVAEPSSVEATTSTVSDLAAGDTEIQLNVVPKAIIPAKSSDGKLVEKEERGRGNVGAAVYNVWLQACGGWPMVSLVVLVYVLCEGLSVAATVWLSYWSEHVDSAAMRVDLLIFVVLQLVSVVFIYLRAYVLYMGTVQGSTRLFRQLLLRVLHAPMAFFESTPLGRLANRFTSDVYVADETLPTTWGALLVTAITVLYTVGTIVGVTPLFAVILVPIAMGYIQSQRYYIQTSRELQRLESISKSPVLSLFGETVEGISTIRAGNAAAGAFKERMHMLVDRNVQALFLNFSVNCWLSVRLEFAGTAVASFAGLCAVWQHGSATSSLFAGFAGVSLSYAFTMTKYLSQSVTNYSSLQTQMISIERIDEYIQLPLEQGQLLAVSAPPSSWPQTGTIDFMDVNLRYQPHMPRVLDRLSFIIPSQAKIGVVGRTGAGKSSVMAALLRLVELESGRILLDKVDIASLPLHTLRRAVSIIPQEPVLFS
ncbi:hypothetical protein DYB25_012421, partial [Aphanomyces astaci]